MDAIQKTLSVDQQFIIHSEISGTLDHGLLNLFKVTEVLSHSTLSAILGFILALLFQGMSTAKSLPLLK